MNIVLSVNCPSYIRKFTEKTFGKNFEANNHSRLGSFILSMLNKKRYYTYAPAERKLKTYNDTLKISVTMRAAQNDGCFLLASDEERVISFLDDEFRKNMYMAAIINKENFGIETKTTIQTFLETYDISEDDLLYESIRKDFNRKKSEIINLLDQ